MKFTELRRYIKNKNLSSDHVLQNCDLVIDGDSYFKNTYRNSMCQFILGPECDSYADFIITKLRIFLDSDVECHVIFKGATKYDLDEREDIHQRVIEDRNDIEQDLENAKYFEPLFVKDVQKQVLEEMDIKYFVCEYDSVEAIVGVAKKLKCPVLTNNIEYCLFGVSCILSNSIKQEQNDTDINCEIYEHKAVKTAIGVYRKMPILLTLLDERQDYLDQLFNIIGFGKNDVSSVIRWVKHKSEAVLIKTISNIIDDEDQNKAFNEFYNKVQTMYLYPSCNLVVKYFRRAEPHCLFKEDKKWLAKGVSNGRIAPVYVILKKNGVIHGSFLMNDRKRPDALLAAKDIIGYSHCLLTNSQDTTITFIRRKCNSISIGEIDNHWCTEISNKDIFTKHRVGKKLKLITGEPDSFKIFLQKIMPGYNYKQLLETVPEDCWILILTLVYYIFKKNKDFINGAYCVLLSYVMLSSKKVNAIKKETRDRQKKISKYYNGLQFLFKKVDVEKKYDSNIVHNFSEFQHCLQHMNYLNKLCGKNIPCTIYHETYNATFIYNTFLFMEDKDHLMKFLENNFTGSKDLIMYKKIVTAFENSLSAVELFPKNINKEGL